MDTVVRINGIPARMLGNTGERVTAIGVGGHHIGRPEDPALGERIIRTAIDEGINFLDNAWCYHDGRSEEIMGRALRDGYRERVFLMTKNHGRDAATYRRQLDESLRRLQTDRIDLVQFHSISEDNEPGRITAEGALEAAIEARSVGKLRFVGFTGHKSPDLHRTMLDEAFAWDTVQMPINLLDASFRSFAQEVLPILLRRGIGIIGMKSLAGGHLLETGVSAREAIAYALSQRIDTLVCGMESLEVLRQNLEIARSWQPLTEGDQALLLARVTPLAADGRLEHYKVG
ncbi:MAG: aldo/keto reductase [Anaerolineae bacterium]